MKRETIQAKQTREITEFIAATFPSFGGGKVTEGNPFSIMLANKPPAFAAGVDISSVVNCVVQLLHSKRSYTKMSNALKLRQALKMPLKAVAMLVFCCFLTGCGTAAHRWYSNQDWTPDSFDYTNYRDRDLHQGDHSFGLSWNLKTARTKGE